MNVTSIFLHLNLQKLEYVLPLKYLVKLRGKLVYHPLMVKVEIDMYLKEIIVSY